MTLSWPGFAHPLIIDLPLLILFRKHIPPNIPPFPPLLTCPLPDVSVLLNVVIERIVGLPLASRRLVLSRTRRSSAHHRRCPH